MCVSFEDIQVIISLQINERGFPGNDRAVCLLLFWLGAFPMRNSSIPCRLRSVFFKPNQVSPLRGCEKQ